MHACQLSPGRLIARIRGFANQPYRRAGQGGDTAIRVPAVPATRGDADLILFTYAAVDSNSNIDAADVVITVNGVDDLIV